MIFIRSLIGLVGYITLFVSLINVWMTWMVGADTSFHWMLALIGALMWLQFFPLLIDAIKERARNPVDD